MHLHKSNVHTHIHTPLEKRASTERLTLKLVPRPGGGNAVRKVPWMQKGCALTSPPFFLTSFLFSSLHLTRSPTSCSDRLREKTWHCIAWSAFITHWKTGFSAGLWYVFTWHFCPFSEKQKTSWMQLLWPLGSPVMHCFYILQARGLHLALRAKEMGYNCKGTNRYCR